MYDTAITGIRRRGDQLRRFIRAFTASRNTGRILLAIPSVTVAVIVTVAALRPADLASRSSVTTLYRATLNEALRERNDALRRICLRNLENWEPQNDEYRFLRAIELQRSGNEPQAVRLLNQIAPDSRIGFPPAHLWLARRVLTQAGPERDDYSAAIHHLTACLEREPDNEEAMELLAQTYANAGQHQLALSIIRSLEHPRPFSLVLQIDLLKQAGQHKVAEDAATETLLSLENRVALDPHDDEARLTWAHIAAMCGRPQDACRMLGEGLDLNATPRLRSAYASHLETVFAQSRSTGRMDANEYRTMVLDAAGKALPEPGVLREVAVALPAIARANGRLPAGLEGVLRRLASAEPTIHVWAALGRLEGAQGNHNHAVMYLRRATETDDPQYLLMLSTALHEAGNCDEAVATASRLVAVLRDRTRRDVRDSGKALMLAEALVVCGRLDEAIEELESARRRAPGRLDVSLAHLMLARYDQLADTAQADSRRLKLVQRLLHISPSHPEALRRLLRLARESSVREQARNLVSGLLVNGTQPGTVAFNAWRPRIRRWRHRTSAHAP